MQCAACNHSYNIRYWEDGYQKEEDFICLTLTNEIKVTSGGDMYEEPKKHELYACPKCGTVKIEIW